MKLFRLAWLAAALLASSALAQTPPPAPSAEADAAFANLLEVETIALARDPTSTDPLVKRVTSMFVIRIPNPTPLMLELQRRGGRDQFWRNIVSQRQDVAGDLGATRDPARAAFRAKVLAKTAEVDADNTAWLKADLASRGRWITPADVGGLMATIPALIVQHADADPAFQQQVLKVWEPMLATGGINGSEYAYLYDRVATGTGQPQRYGTQLIACGPDKVRGPGPVEDAANLDARRTAIGLGPIADYITGAPKCS